MTWRRALVGPVSAFSTVMWLGSFAWPWCKESRFLILACWMLGYVAFVVVLKAIWFWPGLAALRRPVSKSQSAMKPGRAVPIHEQLKRLIRL